MLKKNTKKKFNSTRFVAFSFLAYLCGYFLFYPLEGKGMIQLIGGICAYFFATIACIDLFTSDKTTRELPFNLVGAGLSASVIIGILISVVKQDFIISSIFGFWAALGSITGPLMGLMEEKAEQDVLYNMTLAEAYEILANRPISFDPMNDREKRAKELIEKHLKEKQHEPNISPSGANENKIYASFVINKE